MLTSDDDGVMTGTVRAFDSTSGMPRSRIDDMLISEALEPFRDEMQSDDVRSQGALNTIPSSLLYELSPLFSSAPSSTYEILFSDPVIRISGTFSEPRRMIGAVSDSDCSLLSESESVGSSMRKI